MVNEKRWTKAQAYERTYWQKAADRIASGVSGQLSWYEWRAGELDKRLAPYLNLNEETKRSAKVLEIGSGPIGTINYLKWGERYAIDPLDDFYRSNNFLANLRDPSITYSRGKGEELAFGDASFSLVILDNVLDHVQHAERLLDEIHRILTRDGLLALNVNVHTRWGGLLHSLLSKLLIDQGHPYTFTQASIRVFIHKHKFSFVTEWCQDYYEAREQDRQSSSMSGKVKGYTGLSEFLFGSVCRKITATPSTEPC